MESDASGGKSIERVRLLDSILGNLVVDASELVRDLYSSVRTYLIFGLMAILFGVSELASNMERFQERFYIPLFVAGCLIFCGFGQIVVFNRLRKKYARLFEVETEIGKL